MNEAPAQSATSRMHSIEGARGIAALMVALMHCGHLMRVEQFSGHVGLGGIFDFGYIGVDFFFVLSGFIITYVHYADLGRPERLGVYLWRRLTRIFPIYWFCLALSVVVIALGRLVLGKGGGLDFALSDIPGTIFLLRTSEPKFLGIAWSLQFEVMFYLAFCALLLHRKIGLLALGVWAIVIIVRLFVGTQGNWAGFLAASSLQFIMGVAIALIARHRTAFRTGSLALAGSIACFALAGVAEMQLLPAHSETGRILLGLSSAAILWCLVSLEKQSRIRTPAWLASFGSVSYSVYLMHVLFINLSFVALARIGIYQRLPEFVCFAVGLTCGVTLAACIGFWIELPMVARLKDGSLKVRGRKAAYMI